MTCSNYRSGSGEMWPWCLHCGCHLTEHDIRGGADREASGRADVAGVTTSTPSADGPHGTSSASGGEPAAHAARPVGSHSPTEDRVVDLMTALEESLAAAKAARQSTNRTAPRSR